MRKTTTVLVTLLAAALTVSTAPTAGADPVPSVSAPAEGAVVANGFTGPVTAYFTGIAEPTAYTFATTCDSGAGDVTVDSRSLAADGTSAPQSYSVPAITGPATCALEVRDSGDTVVLTRAFTVAGPALVLGDVAVSPAAFYPTVVDGFRDSVTASWTSNASAGHTVTVLDSRGSVVRRTDLGDLAAGNHSWAWNGRNSSGTRVAVGSYRIRVDADDHAGSTTSFTRSVLVRTGYRTRRHTLVRAGNASAGSASGTCYVTRDGSARTTSLDCWGGRYARASYSFRLPAAAYAVRYSLSGARSSADLCCYGRISRAGSRVSKTGYRVTATVTGWRAFDVRRVAVSYSYRHKY